MTLDSQALIHEKFPVYPSLTSMNIAPYPRRYCVPTKLEVPCFDVSTFQQVKLLLLGPTGFTSGQKCMVYFLGHTIVTVRSGIPPLGCLALLRDLSGVSFICTSIKMQCSAAEKRRVALMQRPVLLFTKIDKCYMAETRPGYRLPSGYARLFPSITKSYENENFSEAATGLPLSSVLKSLRILLHNDSVPDTILTGLQFSELSRQPYSRPKRRG